MGQEETSQKAYKLQQRRANQEWEDCGPQISTRREQSQSKGSSGSKAICGHPHGEGTSGSTGSKTSGILGNKATLKAPQDHSRSASGIAKLPRLHASRSAPPAPAKQSGGEEANC